MYYVLTALAAAYVAIYRDDRASARSGAQAKQALAGSAPAEPR